MAWQDAVKHYTQWIEQAAAHLEKHQKQDVTLPDQTPVRTPISPKWRRPAGVCCHRVR